MTGADPAPGEGPAITDQTPPLTEAPSRAILDVLFARYTLDEIAERISLWDPGREMGTNARRWAHRVPEPHNAWAVGEALRWSDEDTPSLMSQASGLLALLWCGHLADLVGVLAASQRSRLAPVEAHLMAMVQTMPHLLHVSPFDSPKIDADHPVLTGEADEFTLRQIRDTGVVAVPIDTNWQEEAHRLNDRWKSLCVWTMAPTLHEVIADGGRAWFALRRDGVPQHLDDSGYALRVAYAVARSNVRTDVRFDLLREYLAMWFYTVVMPEPPRESVEAWKHLAENPKSATSQALLTELRSYGLIRDPSAAQDQQSHVEPD